MKYIDHIRSKMNNVNHPDHYQGDYGMEVYDVIHNFSEELSGEMGFYQGNAIKYILRWYKKNGVEDLRKAREYIDKMVKLEESYLTR